MYSRVHKQVIHLVGDSGTSSDLAVGLLDLISLLECSSVGAQLCAERKQVVRNTVDE